MTAGEPRASSREPGTGTTAGSGRRRAVGGKRTADSRKRQLEGERRDTWEVALKLLAVRARSQEEIRLHLSRRGYAPDEVAAVLQRLREARYLDDLAFARDWVRARAGRCGFGPGRLARELRAKGIGDPDIRTALAELLAEQSPLDLAEEAARRKLTTLAGVPPAAGRRRLAAHLSRRGFSPEIVLRLCRKHFPQTEESSVWS